MAIYVPRRRIGPRRPVYGRPMPQPLRRHPLPLATAALLLALAGCGSDDKAAVPPSSPASTPTQLDTVKVAGAIKESIKEQRDIKARVTCPDLVLQAKGRDFVCTAKTKDGTTEFAVQQVDDSGNVTYAAAE